MKIKICLKQKRQKPTKEAMKKSILIYLLFLLSSCIQSYGLLTNIVYVTDRDGGGDFSQFDTEIDGYSDTLMVFNFSTNLGYDLSLPSFTFKMSKYVNRTNRVTYVSVAGSAIEQTNNMVYFVIPATNLPPADTYLAELWGSTPGESRQSYARGNVQITRSLFDDASDNYSLSSLTNDISDIVSSMVGQWSLHDAISDVQVGVHSLIVGTGKIAYADSMSNYTVRIDGDGGISALSYNVGYGEGSMSITTNDVSTNATSVIIGTNGNLSARTLTIREMPESASGLSIGDIWIDENGFIRGVK